uniref:Uncharacterized protein n=1 Tax=Schistosoma japonicum TaxID=6182 RepID=C1LHQ6_SCHJA|nr:hypothetical protein [Schistosoma japonicum]
MLSSSSSMLYINVLLLVLIHSSIQIVLVDEHKPNLTSARKNLIQVLNKLRTAYPKERRNIYDYDKCYTLMQGKDNSKKLYETMKRFEEEIRRDYAVFPEKVFEEIMKYTEDFKRLSDNVVGLENAITKYEFERFHRSTLLRNVETTCLQLTA